MRLLAAAMLLSLSTAWPVSADEPGVSPSEITLGIHTAMTGADPLPPGMIAGARLYWRYLHDDLGTLVHGRRVAVQAANDEGTPTTAVALCNMLAQDSLLLVGLSWREPSSACSDYSDPRGIPYLSLAGGFGPTTTPYSLSATADVQARLIAGYLIRVLGDAADKVGPSRIPILGVESPLYVPSWTAPDGVVRIGLVRSNRADADVVEGSIRAELRALGSDLHRVYKVVKTGSDQDARSVATQARSDLIDVLITELGLVFNSRLVLHAESASYHPRFVLAGEFPALDRSASMLCSGGTGRAYHKATGFSPWPAWSDVSAGAFDPHVAIAAAKYEPGMDGDMLLAGWGAMTIVHRLLEDAGADVGRASLSGLLASGWSASTGLFADVDFPQGARNGVTEAHRLEADCDLGAFVTKDAFISGYGG